MNILNVCYDSTNYYLIETNTGKFLVDAGWPGTVPKLLNVFKRKGVNIKNIKYFLVTHFHPDHAGLAQELENQLGFIPELKKYMKPEQHYVEIDLDNNLNLKLNESRDFLSRIGIKGVIISTPGHSDDSVTLILDDGSPFTGDLPGPMQLTEDSSSPAELSWKKIRS